MVEIAPKTIIWDLDGTLINSFEVYRSLVAQTLQARSLLVPTRQEFLKNNHGSLEDSIRSVAGIDDDLTMQEIIADFLEAQESRYKNLEDIFYPDAVALAHRAHDANIKQLIVTNREHQNRGSASPRYIVANSRLREIIGHIVAGEDAMFRKPDARVLEGVQGHNLTQDVLVIGDQFVDAQLAHNIGANAVLVNRNGEIPHLEQLGKWREHVQIVSSLDEVEVIV